MSVTTARALIDAARTRSWAFSDLTLGDGPALLFLRARLITHVATHGAKIEGLVGTSMQYTLPVTAQTLLVTDTGSILITPQSQGIATDNGGLGVPAVGSQYQDGWPIHLTDDGVPYVDFTEAPIATDPFGLYGGTPGFAMPTDMIRLTEVTLVYGTGGALVPCDIIPQVQRHSHQPGRNPAAFLNANRLVPVLPYAATASNPQPNSGDRWANVTAIQISYVGLQQLQALDDVLNLPSVLAEALVADLADYFARQSRTLPLAEKRDFAAEALRCAAAIGTAALDLVNEPLLSEVVFTGL